MGTSSVYLDGTGNVGWGDHVFAVCNEVNGGDIIPTWVSTSRRVEWGF